MLSITNYDYLAFFIYLALFVGIGLWAGRRRRSEAADFYLRQDHLPWYVIGFSLVAAGVSSEQFIGTVGAVYSRGLVTANWEWGILPAVVIMVVLFVPYYLKKRILTTPEFLEKRFDKRVSFLYAVLSVLIYVFINLAGVLYSGAFAMSQILGIDLYWCIAFIASTVGFFSIYGGMASLAWVSVLQAIMLLGSGFTLFVLGINRVEGGFAAIIGSGERAHLIKPLTDPEIPWTALLVLMFSTNVWYYCTSQNINQSVLGAKSQWHGKMGIVFAGFLLLFVPLADVFPGLIAYRLNPALPRADMAFVYVTQQLLPAGGAGVVYGVLIFAVVTAVLSGVNGVSTIFTFDIYKNSMQQRQERDQGQLIKVGRYFAAIVLLTGASFAPVVGSFKHIFDFFQQCWAFVAVPVSLTFLLGVLSKRMTANLAFYLLLSTFPMFLMPYILKATGVDLNIFNVAGVLWVVLLGICLLHITFFGEKKAPEPEPMPGTVPADEIVPWYQSVPFWLSVMVLCYIGIYILFW